MKPAVIILALTTCLIGAQSQGQVFTNQAVIEKAKAGVVTDFAIEATNKSDYRFQLYPSNLVLLREAGVQGDVVRAMATQTSGSSAAKNQLSEPAATTQVASQRPPEPAIPRVTNIGAETEDWDYELGTVALQVAGGLSAGADRPASTVAPAVGGQIDFGLNRYASLIGNYVYHPLGTADYLSCSGGVCAFVPIKMRAHEITGGAKFNIPTSTRFTPFITGSAGLLRASAGASVLGIGISASDSAFIGGGGAGFRLNLTRRLALEYDARLFVGQYDLFYGRTTLGLQVRFN